MSALSSHPTGQLSSLLTLGESSGTFPDYIPYESWPVQAVSKDANASDTYLRSHTPVQEDFLIRLEQRMEKIESLMSQLLEAMSDEDQGDDEPRRYMDGSPV